MVRRGCAALACALLGWLALLGCQQILGIEDGKLRPAEGSMAGAGGALAAAGSGAAGATDTAGAGGAATPTVGIWYSVGYAARANYDWGTLGGKGFTYLVGDVDGDGKADAVAIDETDDSWHVARSNADGFDAPSTWSLSFGAPGNVFLLADVDGDEKADAIAIDVTAGLWSVCLSKGNGFGASSAWGLFGQKFDAYFAADVNGDGKADSVVYTASSGTWVVALSTGTKFTGASVWIGGHGQGSTEQLMGDVDGDGKADAIVFSDPDGAWRVAPSTGTAFDPTMVRLWISGFGIGSELRFLTDIDGDGKADAAAFGGRAWHWMKSTGLSFTNLTQLADEHGAPSAPGFFADVDASGHPSAITVDPAGGWHVLAVTKYDRPSVANTWQALALQYVPKTGNVFAAYDSADAQAIDAHLDLLEAAGVDFLLLDLSGGMEEHADFLLNNAQAVCKRIGARSNSVRFALVVGRSAEIPTPEVIERDATLAYNQFVASPDCEQDYFQLEGKPLLVLFAEAADRATWQASAIDKAASAQFTVRWAEASVPGSGANTPLVVERGHYFGYAFPDGSLVNAAAMVVMPGVRTLADTVSRTDQNGTSVFYQAQGWSRVLASRPALVLVNSFNDFIGETAVMPTDTSSLSAPSEPWLDSSGKPAPGLFWDITQRSIAALKAR